MELNKNIKHTQSKDSSKKSTLSLSHLINRLLNRPDTLVTNESLNNQYYQNDNYQYPNYENQNNIQWQFWYVLINS